MISLNVRPAALLLWHVIGPKSSSVALYTLSCFPPVIGTISNTACKWLVSHSTSGRGSPVEVQLMTNESVSLTSMDRSGESVSLTTMDRSGEIVITGSAEQINNINESVEILIGLKG